MTVQFISPYLRPILLLIGSNLFMTLAWYGHLRFKEIPLIEVIFVAWLIAFIEFAWRFRLIDTAALSTQQRNSRQCKR